MSHRGGPGASTHVEILGNEEVMTDLILIATGAGREVGDRVISRINEIVSEIPWEDEDGWE